MYKRRRHIGAGQSTYNNSRGRCVLACCFLIIFFLKRILEILNFFSIMEVYGLIFAKTNSYHLMMSYHKARGQYWWYSNWCFWFWELWHWKHWMKTSIILVGVDVDMVWTLLTWRSNWLSQAMHCRHLWCRSRYIVFIIVDIGHCLSWEQMTMEMVYVPGVTLNLEVWVLADSLYFCPCLSRICVSRLFVFLLS